MLHDFDFFFSVAFLFGLYGNVRHYDYDVLVSEMIIKMKMNENQMNMTLMMY